jgi:DNA-binding transcriptional MerR regulator
MSEFGTFAKEVAVNLDISTSNLRKWSLLLEDAGYEFERNEKNQRIYYDRDINVLSQMKFVLEKDRNIDNAIKVVMARV